MVTAFQTGSEAEPGHPGMHQPGASASCLWAFDLQGRVAGEDLEVPVRVENRHGGPYGGRGYEAIDQLPDGLTSSTACTVERGSLFVVGELGRDEGCSSEQPAKVAEMLLVPRASRLDAHRGEALGSRDRPLPMAHRRDKIRVPGLS